MRQLMSLQVHSEQSEMTGSSRWMVSYADFITLLFVMFLVLYATLPKLKPQTEEKPTQVASKASASKAQQDKLIATLGDALKGLVDAGDITLVNRPNGMLLEIKDTALFATGTAQPALQAHEIVTQIAETLSRVPNSIVVEGHTDSIPIQTAQYPSNWELSSARAAAIVRGLQEQGISATRLSASGLADTKPKASNDTPDGRSRNRRVSILVLND